MTFIIKAHGEEDAFMEKVFLNIKMDGAIIVSTPQEVALLDVKRGIKMFDKHARGVADCDGRS